MQGDEQMSSGYVPEFIQEDQYVLLDGQERLVTGYYHTPYATVNPADSNKLVILFGSGETVDFDEARVKPLPADVLPGWVQKGKAVELDNGSGRDDDVSHRIVEDYWGVRKKGEWVVRTAVGLVGRPAVDVARTRPVSAKFNARAQLIEESYQQAIARNPDAYRKAPRPDSKKFSL